MSHQDWSLRRSNNSRTGKILQKEERIKSASNNNINIRIDSKKYTYKKNAKKNYAIDTSRNELGDFT